MNTAAGSAVPRATNHDFRSWLRELREVAGLTQEELATVIGTDRRNVRRWEVEGRDPSATMLLRILAAVGADVVPRPPGEAPGALNVELQELRAHLSEASDAAARRHDELVVRLEAQRDQLRELSARLSEAGSRRE